MINVGRPKRLVSSSPQLVGGLIGTVTQLEQRRARIQRNCVVDAPDAADLIQHIVRQRNAVGDGLDRRVHDPNVAPMLMTVAEERLRIPANSEVISIIRKTANVMPTSNAANFARSLIRSLYAILRIPDMFAVAARASREPKNGELVSFG